MASPTSGNRGASQPVFLKRRMKSTLTGFFMYGKLTPYYRMEKLLPFSGKTKSGRKVFRSANH
jgi:hypothetical protein